MKDNEDSFDLGFAPHAELSKKLGKRPHDSSTLPAGMDAAEFKHAVLILTFLKYISIAFEERHARLLVEQASCADPEDPYDLRGKSIVGGSSESRRT